MVKYFLILFSMFRYKMQALQNILHKQPQDKEIHTCLFHSRFPLNRKCKHIYICETRNIFQSPEEIISSIRTTENHAASMRKLKN